MLVEIVVQKNILYSVEKEAKKKLIVMKFSLQGYLRTEEILTVFTI